MEALGGLTRNISTFVRFFESINNLFCQIRWLESNFRNSSSGLLLVVGGILIFCVYLYAGPTGAISTFFGIPGLDEWLVKYGPIVIIVVIIAAMLFRRFTMGPQNNVGFDSIVFGARRDAYPERDDQLESGRKIVRGQTVYHGVPTAAPGLPNHRY